MAFKELVKKRPMWLGLFALGCGSLRLVAGCEDLSQVTPVPGNDASDFDGGFVPELPPDADLEEEEPASDAGLQPGRARIAHLLQGAGPIDLCMKIDAPGTAWAANKITQNPLGAKPEGLNYGEVSTHVLLPITATAGVKFLFRAVNVGSPCDNPEAGAPIASMSLPDRTGANTAIRSGGGITLAIFGIAGARGEYAPKGAGVADLTTVNPGVSQVRLFHGAPDVPALDFVVGNTQEAKGIKYGTAIPYSYTSTNGFIVVDGGVGEGTPLRISSGSTNVEYRLGRVRTRNAATVFVRGLAGLSDAGSEPPLSVSLCNDDPIEGNVGDCVDLAPN